MILSQNVTVILFNRELIHCEKSSDKNVGRGALSKVAQPIEK